MDKVFVSSVMRGYDAERAAVRTAIESLGLRALMAGTAAPASPDPSKTALLALIDEADAVVLILGARYGFVAEHGLSPTEDEFNHARATGKPVFVFVQEGVEREPDQKAFVERVQGGWAQGAFTGFFSTPAELGMRVVQALSAYREEQRTGDTGPVAVDRARELLTAQDRRGSSSGPYLRVVLAPAGVPALIDAVVLDNGGLADGAAETVRRHGLVPQSAGIEAEASSRGLVLRSTTSSAFNTTTVIFAADGAVMVESDVSSEGTMGAMALSYPRAQRLIAAVTRATQDLWALVPNGDLVRQVAVGVCAPEASHTPLVLSGNVGGSMSMPMISGRVLAPDPPLLLRRADIGTEETDRRLAVSLKQAFVDLRAVIE